MGGDVKDVDAASLTNAVTSAEFLCSCPLVLCAACCTCTCCLDTHNPAKSANSLQGLLSHKHEPGGLETLRCALEVLRVRSLAWAPWG